MGKRELINALLEHIDGGVQVAAAYLGITPAAFDGRRYEHKGTRFFSGDELLALQTLSKTALVAEFYAEEANSIVVPKCEGDAGNYDLFQMKLEIDTARGILSQSIVKSIEDGEIDDEETKTLDHDFNELMKAWQSFYIQLKKSHKKTLKV